MKKDIISACTLVLGLTLYTTSSFSADNQVVLPKDFIGREFARDAKISLAKARATALKAEHGGKITDEELETEKGGSGLRYSFDIKKGTTTYEVGVDAKTGKVLENSTEGPNSD